MKKLAVAVIAAALLLGGCKPETLDVNDVIKATQAACAFTPAAAGVIALINTHPAIGTALVVAQSICEAVNNVNPPKPEGGTKFAKGTELSVIVNTPGGPVTIAGKVGKE